MLDAILHLRAFAISLAGNVSYADDLVQATLLRGPENRDGFHPSTSMHTWFFTILRNRNCSPCVALLTLKERRNG